MPSLTSACGAALVLFTFVSADVAPYITTSTYQDETYGLYPCQSYVSNSDITSPIFDVNVQPSAKNGTLEAEGYVFLSPRGTAVASPAPMIHNADGLALVWSNQAFGATSDLRVQEYKGTDYLTFWAGQIIPGYGHGFYYMLNSSYDIVYNLTAVDTTTLGDMHEFQLTTNGTALITVYEPISYDLTAYGVGNGVLMNCLFQEIDVATNDLVFQWRASDHFAPNDSYVGLGSTGNSTENPYDYFHINSVEKDISGNYLVSSRHLYALIYINGTSGDTIWILGGKRNQFDDKSGGNATNFSWQHDARWVNGSSTSLTLFDNGATDWVVTEPESRGIRLNLNTTAMTVSLDHVYTSPQNITSASQGNLQTLNSGHVFMGYGNNPAFTEFAADGTVVWDVLFGVLGNSNTAVSYRAYRQGWTGTPSWNPSIAAGNGTGSTTVYMSWNGATEYTAWALLASNDTSNLTDTSSIWENITRNGFETNCTVGGAARYVRAVALNVNGTVLGASDVLDLVDHSKTPMSGVVTSNSQDPTSTSTDSPSTASGAAAASQTGKGGANGLPVPSTGTAFILGAWALILHQGSMWGV
ncbi:ASST-domain-containing protein [Cryomyces antarcticus]